MSGQGRALALASTQQGWVVTGAPVVAARRRVLEGLFGPSDDRQAGRFELRSPLGRGSFGSVWRAFDPVLCREVAVKLIDGHPDHETTRRFLREARAVASLRCDHVIEVFDFGTVDGSPYLAMELVEGGALDRWLRQPHPWPEVLGVFSAAARGLAAAHAAGLVHRDFKPANVLLGDDGRPRVADFGLAVLAEVASPTPATIETGDPTASTPFAGTPAFMAPEQHLGGTVDRRADVYSWCASLHAALHGGLPFPARAHPELVHDKLHRRICYEPRGAGVVPRWLRAVIRRGLAPDPEHRWPSMEAVLEAIEQGGRRRARRGVTVLGLGLLAASSWWLLPSAAVAPDCRAEAEAALVEVWAPGDRDALRAQLDSRPGLADDVVPRLDRFAGAWVDAHAHACERNTPGPLDPVVHACLERARTELRATVDQLGRGEPAVLDRARQVIRQLEDPDHCSLARARAETAPEDPRRAAEAESIREELAVLRVARRTGRLAAEVEHAAEVAERAAAVGVPSLEAEAVVLHGRALQAEGRFERAAERCEQAHFLASRHDLPEPTFESALCVARVRGVRLGQTELALRWAHQAEAALERAGRGGPAEAWLEDVVASTHWASRDAAAALPHHDRAIELYRRARPPDPRLLAVALTNRANVLADLGRIDEAIASQRQALEVFRGELGPQHELTAAARCALGSLLTDTASPEAITQLDACIASLESSLPADHVWLVQGRANRGLAHRRLGEFARAQADMEDALAAAQTLPGQVGVDVRVGLGTNLGDLLLARGEHQLARERFEAARILAHDELGRGDTRSLLLAIHVAQIDAAAPETRALARVRLRETIATATEHDQQDVAAMARFELARLDPDDALALADAALEHWRTRPAGRSEAAPFPDSASERIAEIERWLAER